MRRVLKMAVAAAAFTLGYLPASASAQVTLPYFEGFEATGGGTFQNFVAALPGAPDFSYGNTAPGEGRLRFDAGPGFNKSGQFAATMDKFPQGGVDQINFLLGQLDMSNYDANIDKVLLDFSFMHHGEEADANDRVWIRGATTSSFIEFVDLNAIQGPPGNYVDLTDLDVSGTLLANGQNFSASFQIRFGQEDNFAAQSPFGNDGLTFDDIQLRLLDPNDVGATAIVAPPSNACGLTSSDVVVVVTNFGAATQSNIPLQVTVAGADNALFNVMVPGPLATGASAQMVAGQVNLFAGGQITVDAVTQLVGDSDATNNASNAVIDSLASEVPVVAPPPGCLGDPANITVTAEPNTNYSWWDAPTGGTELAQGPVFATPPVTMATTYYVQRAQSQVTAGPPDNSLGGGGDFAAFGNGLVFDVSAPLTIDTVHVYPASAGDVTVNVFDSADVLVSTATVAVAAADVGMKTALAVNLAVPPGNSYTINAAGSTVSDLYRNNSGAGYPYASPAGEVLITGAINNQPNFYYFFYDWKVSTGGCAGERTPVTVDASAAACSADLVLAKVGPPTAVAGGTVEYQLTVTNNGPTGASAVSLADPGAAGLTFVSNTGDCTTAFPCDLGIIAAGSSKVVTATFDVAPDASGSIENTATVTSASAEANPGDESASSSVTINAEADLALIITAAPSPAQSGGTLTYTVEVSNAGPSDASGVSVATALGAAVSAQSTSGCDNDPAGVPNCALGTLAAGASVEFDIVTSVDAMFTGTVTSSATASSDALEASPGDETDDVSVEVTEDGTSGVGGAGGAGGAGSGGAGGAGGGPVVIDSGCGCRVSGGSHSSGAAWLALLGLALVGLRRRRLGLGRRRRGDGEITVA